VARARAREGGRRGGAERKTNQTMAVRGRSTTPAGAAVAEKAARLAASGAVERREAMGGNNRGGRACEGSRRVRRDAGGTGWPGVAVAGA
jgi:hypothetical protein